MLYVLVQSLIHSDTKKKIEIIRHMYMPGMPLAARMTVILYRLEKAELHT